MFYIKESDEENYEALNTDHCRYARSPHSLHRHISKYMVCKQHLQKPVASTLGCFKCRKRGCSLAPFLHPKDEKAIPQNFFRWRCLRNINSKVNMSDVVSVCEYTLETSMVHFAMKALEAPQYTITKRVPEDNDMCHDGIPETLYSSL